tara:strand:- start:1400 stop:1741 length:342 start_codon:yes stop_codon:yes gene_type:complete
MARMVSMGVKPTPNFVKMPNVELATASAVDSNKTYFVDTSAASVTLTLPANPSMGDIVRIFDVRNTFDSNNCIVDRNGHAIMGANDNLTVNTEGAAFELVYYNSSYGWRLFTI